MSYRNVISDFKKAKLNITQYLEDLNDKYSILVYLISNYNDGKTKGFYCLSVDLLPLQTLKSIMKEIEYLKKDKEISIKEKAKIVKEIFETNARKEKIELSLRNNS